MIMLRYITYIGGEKMKNFNGKKFCDDIVKLRKHLTQQKFAEILGINRSTLSLLESGKQIPSLEILTKICTQGNFNLDDYFEDTESDGLFYLMGTLEEGDKEKIKKMICNIQVKEKYEMLSRRCN